MSLKTRVLEVCALVCVPAALMWCLLTDIASPSLLTSAMTLLPLDLMALRFEGQRPAMRQLMPTIVLAAAAAAGRVLFAPFPNVKPVSAIAIIAGACLGRSSGFAVGALAALASNFFFGQGEWTPLQMYSWGLIGYVAGLIGEAGLAESDGPFKGRAVYVWGMVSAFVYGLVMNGWYVIGYVRPITWPSITAAFAGGIPLDVVHGISTVVFLGLVWGPTRRSIERVVAKYGLG